MGSSELRDNWIQAVVDGLACVEPLWLRNKLPE